MDSLNKVLQLLENGGSVLWVILFVSICLWSLICERFIYFKWIFPEQQSNYLSQWQKQTSYCKTKEFFYVKNYILSDAKISMEKTITIIKMLIAICPMLGLLGTVVGMIHVFDVMAVTGTGNARAMAAGISQATISTMAGMIIAISGLYFYLLIKRKIDDNIHQLRLLLR